MAKRSSSINDETDHLLNYHLNRSEKDWDSVIDEVIKYYTCDYLTRKQVREAIKHTGRDTLPADEILRNFSNSWMNDNI